ncbi:4Fe-4S binding protein [Sinanaerobacter chloroacetimidivorans]|uniref:4Fe-4S binding protein n=1 Tax=Sinanaerobacter chloroacetimidivorans TaxID=2818044 RepID=A0A8J7W7G1_9FIRM|nr:4Fe-4S binding protein [Sinanaerobacter chloroacetimidivorans]MBR0600361.1 4Fe-4S binding protein [Sinanaerobacter chloroacetimidivorans]
MKKRQRIRNLILLLSFLLFPVTQFYFSPYLIIWGASQGMITASFFTFAVFLFGSLFVGRAFCGWVMPCGSFQELCFQVNDKEPKTGKLNLLKFVIWVPWLITIFVMALLAGGYKRVEYFFAMDHGISVSNIYAYIIYYGVLLLFLLLSLIFGKRATCHYICWMSPFMIIGRKISNWINLPSIRLKSKKENCVQCGSCRKACPMSLEVNKMVTEKNMENSECILCGKCADVCPKNVITMYFGRL